METIITIIFGKPDANALAHAEEDLRTEATDAGGVVLDVREFRYIAVKGGCKFGAVRRVALPSGKCLTGTHGHQHRMQ